MEDNTNFVNQPAQQAPFFAFDSPKNQSSYIKVIGVGGGGGNAVNHMYRQGIKGVDFIVCNTDMKALNASPVPNKIPLGDLGLGAGNKPERASKAATDKAEDIKEAIAHNTQMLFITAGMGGGTGTGAAPVIAEIAKNIDLETEENKKILVVAIVTRPFSFEGKKRRDQAEAGIEELRKHVDSIIVINNDKLRAFGDLDISEAFGLADDVLLTAAKGIAEIITGSGNVNIDFQDVNTVMEHSGTALMGAGSGKGENRAIDAITAASTSVLLDDSDIRGAKNVLLYFSYSSDHELTMDEQGEITAPTAPPTSSGAPASTTASTTNSRSPSSPQASSRNATTIRRRLPKFTMSTPMTSSSNPLWSTSLNPSRKSPWSLTRSLPATVMSYFSKMTLLPSPRQNSCLSRKSRKTSSSRVSARSILNPSPSPSSNPSSSILLLSPNPSLP